MKQGISLIPYPFFLEECKGTYQVNKNPVEIVCKDASIYSPILEQLVKVRCGGNGVAIKIIKAEEFEGHSLKENESYCVKISPDSIDVYSASKQGVFYGFQTICQLLMAYKKELPCLFIYDKPAYSWRGFLLDTCRSFYSVDFIKKMIGAAAFHKFNVFHWHLTDDQGWRLPVPEYPELVEKATQRAAHTMPESIEGEYDEGGVSRRYYTEEEIKDIVNFAAENFITVVPEVEFPGHSSALLAAYPEFGCTGGPYHVENRWGIFPDVLCLGKDKIFDFYDKVFDTIDRLFPGKYLHIGGDECPHERWEVCPDCQRRMKEQKLDNISQLQSWGTTKISEIVLKHNKIPIGWDEVLDNTEKKPLPDEVIVQSWRGFEGGEKAVSLGHTVIMSPVSHCYMNFKNYPSFEEPGRLGCTTVDKAYSYTPVTEKMSDECKSKVIGGECSLWSEALPSSKVAEYLIFPRFCALSEAMWLDEKNKDFERFEKALPLHKQRLKEMNILYYDGRIRN